MAATTKINVSSSFEADVPHPGLILLVPVIKVKFVPFKRYKVKLRAPCQVGSSASFISLHKGLKLSRAETSGNTIEVTIKLTRQQVVILRYESPCTF